MNLNEKKSLSWLEPGQIFECSIKAQTFGTVVDGEVELRLRIDEVLEEFEGRRVLVASAIEVIESEEEVSDEDRQVLLHPAYLIEETTDGDQGQAKWPDEVADLVRAPVSVEVDDSIRRSVFVDNVGISVGDLVDLLRGQLEFSQVRMIFGVVADLFTDLHEAGWIHLGLTPWNVRVFEEDADDGFPKIFLAPPPLGEPGQSHNDFGLGDVPTDASEASEGGDAGGLNPFDGGEKTVMELTPLSFAADSEKSAVDAGSAQVGDAETSHAEEKQGAEVNLKKRRVKKGEMGAIFDGIDRLYPAGKIEDEIAVTPGFSAPELLSGMGSADGESADVFSLGMLLYFLVAGEVPPASVYTRYAPAIPARNFRPGFPPGLQAVISRATRPRPDDRYASVRALRGAFEEACEIMEMRSAPVRDRFPALRLASDLHIGIAKGRRNPTNQDSVFSATSDDGRFALVVVADGVSTASYGTGDLASTALTEEAVKVWEDALPSYLMDEDFDDVEIIQSILRRANKRIVEYVNENHSPFRGSPHEVMGSTALIAVIVDGMITLGSLGDSRVYLQRGAGMEQITIDHNLWTLSILEGVDADSALAMPHGDALARCLGTFIIEKGVLIAVDPQPDLFRFRVISGDTVLLTTDGLVDFAGTNLLASEDNILSLLLAEPDPALACLEMILLANRGGGGDNIGVSVARFY